MTRQAHANVIFRIPVQIPQPHPETNTNVRYTHLIQVLAPWFLDHANENQPSPRKAG